MLPVGKKKSLFNCFRLQYKVIHALVLREIHTRYGRENLRFLWVIGEAVLFCTGVAIVWTAICSTHEMISKDSPCCYRISAAYHVAAILVIGYAIVRRFVRPAQDYRLLFVRVFPLGHFQFCHSSSYSLTQANFGPY